MSAAVGARGLRVGYGGRDVLRGLDLEIRRGEIVALLGPNGAGKTTLVEVLAGLRRRAAGAVSVLGADPAHAGRDLRGRVGIVLQESQPDPGLTVAECLRLYAGYYERPRPIAEVAALTGLADELETPAELLSGGTRRRLDLAIALVGAPELLFLDEPTTGFDPAARRATWAAVDGLRREGATVVLTTHAMDEAERLADRIAVLVGGAIVAEGTPAALGARARAAAEVRFSLPPGSDRADLPAPLRGVASGARGVVLQTATPLADVAALAGWAREQAVEVADLEVRRPSLEDAYLALVSAHHPDPEEAP